MPIVHHLIADQFGTHIGKYQGRLRITRKKEVLAQAPLMHLQTVRILSRGVSISADALAACCEQGIPVHFVDERGKPFAGVYAVGLTGTILTRREQLRAYDDERGFYLAQFFALSKVQNQMNTLRYLARNREQAEDVQALNAAVDHMTDSFATIDQLPPQHVDDLRATLMAHEAQAAKHYWQAARVVVPESYGWTHRETRGATDPVNSLLNYGYGILYGEVERAIILAGLDPYAGFIHADRPGKPSLTLDLIEPFRQVAVDRVLFGLLNRQFTVEQDDRARLLPDTRHAFADHVLSRLDSKSRYNGERHPLRHIIQGQARQVAAYLRGETHSLSMFEAEV